MHFSPSSVGNKLLRAILAATLCLAFVPAAAFAGASEVAQAEAPVIGEALVASLPNGVSLQESVEVNGQNWQSEARKVLDLVNQARAAAGVAALTWDENMEAVAMQRAAETSVYWDHTRPDGSSCFTAWPSDYQYYAAGENIAMGQRSAEEVNTDWTNSSGHYANMVNSNYTSVGIACFIKDGACYWVECFSGHAGTGMNSAANDSQAVYTVQAWASSPEIATYDVDGRSGYAYPVRLSDGQGGYLDNTQFSWRTSDPTIVNVSSNGYIGCVAAGVAEVTASYQGVDLIVYRVTVSDSGETTLAAIRYSDVFNEYMLAYAAGSGLWYVDQGWLDSAVQNKLMGQGITDFRPYDTISRAEVITVLFRTNSASQDPESSNNDVDAGFTDVARNQYYTAAVKWGAELGLVTGYEGRFRPGDPITREELATMLGRYAGLVLNKEAKAPAATAGAQDALDWGQVSSWAYEGMAWCTENGVITGSVEDSGTYLHPQGDTLRCQMAKMIVATIDVLTNSSSTK